MVLDCNDAELTLLTGMLRSELDAMRSEITHTDTRAYRETLQRRRALVESILGKLSHADREVTAGA